MKPVLQAPDNNGDHFSNSEKEAMKGLILEIRDMSELIKFLLYFARNSVISRGMRSEQSSNCADIKEPQEQKSRQKESITIISNYRKYQGWH